MCLLFFSFRFSIFKTMKATKPQQTPKPPGLFSLLRPYRVLIILLIFLAMLSNGLNLWIPRLIGQGIDDFQNHQFTFEKMILNFVAIAAVIFLISLLQGIVQTYASEQVARDLRSRIAERISVQQYTFIEKHTSAKLLTNLSSDVDSIKLFVSQAIVSIVSSLFIIIGASVLLININWKLGVTVIAIIPLIGGAFYMVIRKVKPLFKRSREVIDWLNKVINESILGAALIRVINSQFLEYEKFFKASQESRDIGLQILRLFAWLIPIIVFIANLAGLGILVFGGKFVINNEMTIGDFAAFNSYLALLIFPILVIGFMSNVIAQATASFNRIVHVLEAPDPEIAGTLNVPLMGRVEVKNLTLKYGQKYALRDISFQVEAGSSVAVIGPTAAGKSTLLAVLTGLSQPDSGEVLFDGQPVSAYDPECFYKQIALVFQDSILFNLSIRENIAFNAQVTAVALEKAIATAELTDFIQTLPQGLDTKVSERGLSLSGGQKQRIMLARALALDPKVLLLDDFTARVDVDTEARILRNVRKNYPQMTTISVTQKIAALENYSQLILMMQGEILAQGTHEELLRLSPEYVQIFNSQQSTSNYEL